MTGAELLCYILRDAEIKFFCGIPGTDNTDIYQVCREFGVRPIIVRNEMFAPMFADGYSRVARKPGCVLTIPGPGALALCSGLMEAYASSVPMLAIVTDIPSLFRGKKKGYLHEIRDLASMFTSVTQRQIVIHEPGELSCIYKLVEAMCASRPRPSVVIVPTDVYKKSGVIKMSGYPEQPPVASPDTISDVAQAIRKAKRPIVFAGAGVWWSKATPALSRFIAKTGIPVFTSVNGKGVLSDTDPDSFGQWIHEPEMQALITKSDLVLALGTRWSDRSTGRWSLKLPRNVIDVNISSDDFNKNYHVSRCVVSDIELFLESLQKELDYPSHQNLAWRWRLDRAQHSARQCLSQRYPKETALLDTIRKALPAETIVVNDSTIFTYWTRRYFPVFLPGTFLWPMGSGTIGWALPASLGARLALQETNKSTAPVVALVGDGGLQWSMQELGTMMQENLPVIIVLFDDSAYGVIRAFEQGRYNNTTPATKLQNPRFDLLAESYDIPYTKANNEQEVALALSSAVRAPDQPILIHYPTALVPPPTL